MNIAVRTFLEKYNINSESLLTKDVLAQKEFVQKIYELSCIHTLYSAEKNHRQEHTKFFKSGTQIQNEIDAVDKKVQIVKENFKNITQHVIDPAQLLDIASLRIAQEKRELILQGIILISNLIEKMQDVERKLRIRNCQLRQQKTSDSDDSIKITCSTTMELSWVDALDNILTDGAPIQFLITFSLSLFSATFGLAKCLKNGVAGTFQPGGVLDGLCSVQFLLAFLGKG